MTKSTETSEDVYANKEFAKEVITVTAKSAASVVAAYGGLLVIGFAYSKYLDHKAKKNQK